MADGLTTNLSFTLPEVGASDDTWGTKLNANWSALDQLFNASGYLKHETGGLEADVSAYSGLLKITGGATSAVTITSAGEALLDDADAAAQRTTLGLVIGTNVQAYDAGLASIAGLTTAADKMIYTTASATFAVTDLSAFGRTLIDDADASTARATLGLTIGTDVQAYDALLADIAGMTLASGDVLYADGAASLAQLAKGTAGQVLTMNSGATAPEWADASGGGWTLIEDYDGAPGVADRDITIPAGASEVMIFVHECTASSNGTEHEVTLGDSGGIETTGYDAYVANGSGTNTSTTEFPLSVGTLSTGHKATAKIHLINVSGNEWAASIDYAANSTSGRGGGTKTTSAALTTVRFSTAVGTLSTLHYQAWYK